MNLEIAAFHLGKWYYPKTFSYIDEEILPQVSFLSLDGVITTPLFYTYTGFKDINGNKIYDRDIVEATIKGKEHNGTVRLKDGCWVIIFKHQYRIGDRYFKTGYLKDYVVKSLGPGMYTEV